MPHAPNIHLAAKPFLQVNPYIGAPQGNLGRVALLWLKG